MDPQLTVRGSVAFIAAVLLPLPALSQDADDETADASYSRKGADTCLACHDDEKTLSLFRTRHAVPGDPRTPFGRGQLQCEACHGPGGAHGRRIRRGQERPPVITFEDGDPTPVPTRNGMCLECHDGDVGFGWHAGPHDNDEVACADCHQAHATRDAVLHTASQTEVCFDCHQLQRSETLKAFSHPFFEGKMDCSGCHSPHGSTTAFQFARQTPNDTCFDCHAEKRGPFLWEHAPVSEDCALCHAPHGSNHPGMLVSRAPLLCQSCHSPAGHPSIPNDPGGLAGEMPSQYLLGQSCLNCHEQVHGSNHPSGSKLMR